MNQLTMRRIRQEEEGGKERPKGGEEGTKTKSERMESVLVKMVVQRMAEIATLPMCIDSRPASLNIPKTLHRLPKGSM